jgi:hypothetical protein
MGQEEGAKLIDIPQDLGSVSVSLILTLDDPGP